MSLADRRETYASVVRTRWLSRRAVVLHIAFGIFAAACIGLGWWQLTRALDGNGLSWFYTVEWPVLAALAVWGWWHLIHELPEDYQARKQRPPEWDARPDVPAP